MALRVAAKSLMPSQVQWTCFQADRHLVRLGCTGDILCRTFPEPRVLSARVCQRLR